MNSRIENVVARIKKSQLDAILITDYHSIDYLIGYANHPGERFFGLIITNTGAMTLILNNLFFLDQKLDCALVWYSDTDTLSQALSPALKGIGRLGVDKKLEARFLLELQAVFDNIHFTIGSGCVDEVRMVKDEAEIALMKKASAINDQAMDLIKDRIATGNFCELELKDQLKQIYLEQGADDFSFEPIIAFGKNGANPHHELDRTRLHPGDSVIVDIGCLYEGYCSDMTRTFFFEEVSNEHRKLYEIVKNANEKAIAMIKPGVLLKDIDATARDYIEQEGYGTYFNHRLGHFIGREVHEYGDVSSRFDLAVRPGMIFSIEPGLYLKDDVGIRIEDLVLVTEQGAVSLNGFNKDLVILKEK